jgi:hypothetical protein
MDRLRPLVAERSRSRRDCTGRLARARIAGTSGTSEDHLMDKKAKTPKKPKQNKAKDAKAK